MKALTRGTFLKAGAPRLHKVEAKALGGYVFVRAMSALETTSLGDTADVAKLIARFTVNKDGVRLFTDEDEATIADMAIADMRPIFDKIIEINGLSTAVNKELEGNSPASDATSSS